MSPKNRTSLIFEALEDRVTPSLTYTMDSAGDLTVTGTTPNNVAIEGFTPAGFNHNGNGGSDTVTVGYNLTDATTGAVTVRGNVYAQNTNIFGLGAETTGPAVVVQGLTSITTHNSAGITFANP